MGRAIKPYIYTYAWQTFGAPPHLAAVFRSGGPKVMGPNSELREAVEVTGTRHFPIEIKGLPGAEIRGTRSAL